MKAPWLLGIVLVFSAAAAMAIVCWGSAVSEVDAIALTWLSRHLTAILLSAPFIMAGLYLAYVRARQRRMTRELKSLDRALLLLDDEDEWRLGEPLDSPDRINTHSPAHHHPISGGTP